MYKKLTEEKINDLMEVAIAQFAENGIDKANINEIAKLSQVSVGVIYKYYGSKEGFFLECLRYSVGVLDSVIKESMNSSGDLIERTEKLIRSIQYCSRKYNNHTIMYHEITAGSSRKYASLLASEIEGISARVYTSFIEQAKKEGIVRSDMDSRLLAFFYDNLLLMLQFSYSCDYFKERFKIYCGEEVVNDNELVVEQLLKFLESAFYKGGK